MRQPQKAPDWPLMIDQLVEQGSTLRDIGTAMHTCMLTNQMLRAYRAGVQPLHYRGEALVALWCEKLGKKRDDLPMALVVRGHRVQHNRELPAGPQQHAALPQWPPVLAVAKKVAAKRSKKAKESA